MGFAQAGAGVAPCATGFLGARVLPGSGSSEGGRRKGSGRDSRAQDLAEGWRSFPHLAPGDHGGSGNQGAECGHVPDAGAGAMGGGAALATAQSRGAAREKVPGDGKTDAGGGGLGRGSGECLCGHGPVTRRDRRVHVRRICAEEVGGLCAGGEPTDPGAGGCRLCDRGNGGSKGGCGGGRAFRGSHRILHSGGQVSAVQHHGNHAPQGRGLSGHRGGQAADGGFLAGIGQCPDPHAGAEDELPGAGGFGPAGGGGLSQSGLCQPEEAVSLPGLQVDARPLGSRADDVHQDDRGGG